MNLTKQTITKIEKFHYKGKVYNLTTSSGNLIVNGIAILEFCLLTK
ncbi:hypothetical protein HYY70_06180 [Candidatus Woesearchaeota archaeon]|nr:hypothetical protein [Candidatus Woesearchaeota archaeon]